MANRRHQALENAQELLEALVAAPDLSTLAARCNNIHGLSERVCGATDEGRAFTQQKDSKLLLQLLNGPTQLYGVMARAVARSLQLLSDQLEETPGRQLGAVQLEALMWLLLGFNLIPEAWVRTTSRLGVDAKQEMNHKILGQLDSAGTITALGHAMSAGAAALRMLLQEQQQSTTAEAQASDYSSLPQLLLVLTDLLRCFRAMRAGTGCFSTMEPWPPVFVAQAALAAAQLEFLHSPAAQKALTFAPAGDSGISSPAGAAGPSATAHTGSRSKGPGRRRQQQDRSCSSSSAAAAAAGAASPTGRPPAAAAAGAAAGGTSCNDPLVCQLKGMVGELLVAGDVFSLHLKNVVLYNNFEEYHMSLLGSQDVFQLLLMMTGFTAQQLRVEAAASSTTPSAGTSSRGRSSSGQSSMCMRDAVPCYHQQLLHELHPLLPQLLQDADVLASAVVQPELVERGVTNVLECLSYLVLGSQAAPDDIPPNPFVRDVLALWPPAVNVPPHLLLPLLRVVIELLVLGPAASINPQQMSQGLKLLDGVQQQHQQRPRRAGSGAAAGSSSSSSSSESAATQAVMPGLLELYLHVLGPAVLLAATQQSSGATATRAHTEQHADNLSTFTHMLHQLLSQVDSTPAFVAQPVTCASVCEAVLRLQVPQDTTAPAGSNSSGNSSSAASQRAPLAADELAHLAGCVAAACRDAAAASGQAASTAGNSSSSSHSPEAGDGWTSRQLHQLTPHWVSLLASCVKVSATVTARLAGPWCAASQMCTALEAALLLADLSKHSNDSSSSTSSSNDSSTPTLKQLLEPDRVAWMALSARVLHAIGQQLEALSSSGRSAGSRTSRHQGDLKSQAVTQPHLVDTCSRAVDRLTSQLRALQEQLPAAELDACLEEALDVVTALQDASKAAGQENSALASVFRGIGVSAFFSVTRSSTFESLAPVLQAVGLQAANLLPTAAGICNNPECSDLSGVSEKAAVRSGRCSGCLVSRYCGRSCQTAHWREGHKPICKVLKQ